jgi:hypothetical protein
MLNTVFEAMQKIHAHYRDIHTATAGLGQDSEPDDFTLCAQRREEALAGIITLRMQLDSGCRGWRDLILRDARLRAIWQEILTVISMLADLDKSVQLIMQARMESLRTELSGLQDHSRAALAYTRQSTH